MPSFSVLIKRSSKFSFLIRGFPNRGSVYDCIEYLTSGSEPFEMSYEDAVLSNDSELTLFKNNSYAMLLITGDFPRPSFPIGAKWVCHPKMVIMPTAEVALKYLRVSDEQIPVEDTYSQKAVLYSEEAENSPNLQKPNYFMPNSKINIVIVE